MEEIRRNQAERRRIKRQRIRLQNKILQTRARYLQELDFMGPDSTFHSVAHREVFHLFGLIGQINLFLDEHLETHADDYRALAAHTNTIQAELLLFERLLPSLPRDQPPNGVLDHPHVPRAPQQDQPDQDESFITPDESGRLFIDLPTFMRNTEGNEDDFSPNDEDDFSA